MQKIKIFHGCNENNILAQIILEDDNKETHYFKAIEEDKISDFLESKIGDAPAATGMPEYIEASSWCVMASIGDVYDSEKFMIEIMEL